MLTRFILRLFLMLILIVTVLFGCYDLIKALDGVTIDYLFFGLSILFSCVDVLALIIAFRQMNRPRRP